jgi:hypothetical protein
MSSLDRDTERAVMAYAGEVMTALGDACVGVVLYGSAAGIDWVLGRSDINTVIVLRQVSVAALDALAPVLAGWRAKGVALPVILDHEQVERARLLFPMELDDIQRQHRVLAGVDPFADLASDDAALRREIAQEAFGKLLRLRAFYLEHAADPPSLTRMMAESVKSFLIVVRHLLRLRGVAVPEGYAATLAAGETAVGPLPAMRRVLAQRSGAAADDARARGLAADYVGEAERVVAAVAAYCV